MGQVSIKTKFGWISAYEQKDKIVKVQFGKLRVKLLSKNLKKFKKNINDFFKGKSKTIKSDFLLNGSSTQKKFGKN